MKRKRLKLKRLNTIKARQCPNTEAYRAFEKALALTNPDDVEKIMLCPFNDLYVIVLKSNTIGGDVTIRNYYDVD
jgi:hypothetical protein